MPLREYITTADIKTKLFNQFPLAEREEAVLAANEECEDLAIRRGVTDPADIADTTHFKLRKYLICYAVAELAQDNIDANNTNSLSSGINVYERLFKRQMYLMQNLKPQITKVMITGEPETQENRAYRSQRIYRG